MQTFIASDHGGLELKNLITGSLPEFNFTDLGPQNLNPEDDYVDYAHKLALTMQKNPNSKGILICRSGIGMCIAANKFKGIYAALAYTEELAKKSREHNNANVLCLDSDYSNTQDILQTVKAFLETEFSETQTRHLRRVSKIYNIEKENFK